MVNDSDLGSVCSECQVSRHRRLMPAPAGFSGRQVIDDQVSIVMPDGEPRTVRAELCRESRDLAPILEGDPAMVDIPDRECEARYVGRGQVAPVGAEAKDKDFTIAAGLESGNLAVIGHAANDDRSVAKTLGETGHRGIEGILQDEWPTTIELA